MCAMAACRRSARLAPVAKQKLVVTPTDHSKSMSVPKSFSGEALVASIKEERCTSPYEVRDQVPRTPTPNSGSKRKLSFEAVGRPGIRSRKPSARANLEKMTNSFSPLHVVIKQEERLPVDDVKPDVFTFQEKRDTNVKVEVPDDVEVKVYTKRPRERVKRASEKSVEDVSNIAKGKVKVASRKAVKREKVDSAERPIAKQEDTSLEVATRDGETGMEVALSATSGGPAVAAPASLKLTVASGSPYPTFARPHGNECYEVRNRLAALHGLGEYVRHKSCPTIDPVDSRDPPEVLGLEYRPEERKTLTTAGRTKIPDLDVIQVEEVQAQSRALTGSPSERRTVLDSLVGTILSQNTTDNNSKRAFASLKVAFSTWEEVHGADPKAVEDAIRCGGLAETKAKRIINILDTIFQERGSMCLEYVRHMTVDEIKAELSRFKGVGPKTVACVLMFHLQQNEFPVDTHVFRLCKMLGWVPAGADREKTYLHMNSRVPDDIKFDLHCLLVTHGKRCPRCAKGGRAQTAPDGPCPLVNWSLEMALESIKKTELLKGEA